MLYRATRWISPNEMCTDFSLFLSPYCIIMAALYFVFGTLLVLSGAHDFSLLTLTLIGRCLYIPNKE